jgi:hypothetical protein
MDFKPIPVRLRARARIALQILQDPEWLQREAEFLVSGNYGEQCYTEWQWYVDSTNRVTTLVTLLFAHGFGLSRDRSQYLFKCLTEEQKITAHEIVEKVIKESIEV